MGKATKQSKAMRASLGRRTQATRGRVSLPQWDHGATGPANRHGLIVEERGEVDARTGRVTNPNGVTGARRVDLLQYWHRRGTISTGGYNAATTLRDAYEATLTSGLPALPDNDRVQSSPKPDHAVTIRIYQIGRFARLMRLVAREDRQIVTRCVLDGWHPSRIYGALRTKDGLRHLHDALDRLHAAMAS